MADERPIARGPAPARHGVRPAVWSLVFAAAVAASIAPGSGWATPARAMTASGAGSATGTPGLRVASDSSATVEPTSTASPSTISTIGTTVRGRPILLERFGSGARHVLIVGGLHGTEAGGLLAARFKAYLRAHPSAIPSGTVVDVIAYSNPDGRYSNRRGNAHRVDLNRNFPAGNWTRRHAAGTLSHGPSPGSEPETKALVSVLESGGYVRVIALHSRGGFIDPDGGSRSRSLAKRVARAAGIRVFNLPAYRGSMGSYVPEKLGIPIITWELSSRRLTKRVRAGLLESVR